MLIVQGCQNVSAHGFATRPAGSRFSCWSLESGQSEYLRQNGRGCSCLPYPLSTVSQFALLGFIPARRPAVFVLTYEVTSV